MKPTMYSVSNYNNRSRLSGVLYYTLQQMQDRKNMDSATTLKGVANETWTGNLNHKVQFVFNLRYPILLHTHSNYLLLLPFCHVQEW